MGDKESEVWKNVKGWEGKYLISNTGRFKSIDGKYKVLHPNGYITLGTIETIGYRSVTLRRVGVMERYRIHVLVGEHFVKKPKSNEKLCINHIDGNKLNNNHINLEWVTPGDNIRHAVKMGLHNLKGELHPHVKLTEDKVIEMRLLRKRGLTHQEIGNMFGICRRQAGDVINGVNWGWLKEGL